MNAKEAFALVKGAVNEFFDDYPYSFVLMQDGDGCHTAKVVRNRRK